MRRNPSHRRKVQRKRLLRNRAERDLAYYDLMAFGTGCVYIDKDGNVRHVDLKDVYDDDKINLILTKRQSVT